MLFFMGFNSSEGNWTGNFTEAVRNELIRRNISFSEIPPFDWYSTDIPLQEIRNIRSNSQDAWFLSWAQSPMIEEIKDKPGRKYGYVVGLTAMPFEPAVLIEAADGLRERYRLSLYDKILVTSQWCKTCLCRSYPELADQVIVTGFPFDFQIYEPYRGIQKEEKLVVFNQRFALEKLHVLELEVARRLVDRGYRVQHLSGSRASQLIEQDKTIGPLLDIAEEVGVEFIFNPTKDKYHRRLSSASVVVTTSLADMLPSSMIEAIYLNVVPVAPASMCFSEFIHRDNLYTPYDVEEVVSIVDSAPERRHHVDQYHHQTVVGRFLEEIFVG